MGSWVLHVEGHGIHDNDRPDDADAMFKAFITELARHHDIASATLTVGGTRELVHPSAVDSGRVAQRHERVYRYR